MKKLIQNGQLEFVTGGWVMTDEANSHWQSMLLQLTEGQTWLQRNFNITPTSSWAIDPFGYSPTMPYIMQKSGFKNMLIQRTHYAVKKELAMHQQLEFYWRQLWDDTGSTDLFTHMMPFYSYDIPHTCGPDPKICCQFDFKRMQGFGLSCPWRVQPQAIDEHNVAQRAEMLVDQWKKKAQLYRTKALLIPLGDDFRFSQSTEWDVQRMNYERLFDYINNEPKMFVNAQFGTLHEYFAAVHKQEPQEAEFPTLSGDFFTYADRADNYWSGYFTSRPYHKRMDRVLLHYVRAAEMLHSWHAWEPAAKFSQLLQLARRELSLFQHHDAITGTAKTHVVQDYARRMLEAVKACRMVMQQAVYRLLTKPDIYNADFKFTYFYLDETRWPGADDSRTTIILGAELPIKYVAFHNSLPRWREEYVDFYVSGPFMSVSDLDGNAVEAQINPIWSWHWHSQSDTITPQSSTTKYRLIFRLQVPPLGLVTYVIRAETEDSRSTHTTFARTVILTTNPISVQVGDYPHEPTFGVHRELTLRIGQGPKVVFGTDGLLKSVQPQANAAVTNINLKFYKYRPRISSDRSGAYLFIPNGPATPFVSMKAPVVLLMEGALESSVTAGHAFVVHQTILRAGEQALEVRNYVDIGEMDDTEVVMRYATNIMNGDTFYTDLNGLQMIKRQRFSKLPLQANYYPVPTAIYIEDESTRLTLLGGQPLGGTSLAEGEVEIMLERRLTHDDERGLGQGVLDNQPMLQVFRLLLETMNDEACVKQRPVPTHPAGVLTRTAYHASKELLNPVDKFIYVENDWLGVQASFGAERRGADEDIELIALRNLETKQVSLAVARDREHVPQVQLTTGIVVHRTKLLHCGAGPTHKGNKKHTGIFDLKNFFQHANEISSVHSSTLTFLQLLRKEQNLEFPLCPMDTKAYKVQLQLRS